jgi:hypothetical protein
LKIVILSIIEFIPSKNNRTSSTGAGDKRIKGTNIESPTYRNEGSDASYSPRRSNLKPSGAPNHVKARFTTTMMAPFRGKGGFSAPESK